MKILITGGTGFIGSRLALKALKKGWEVNVLGQENNPAESENKNMIEKQGAKVFMAPITDPNAVKKALDGVDWVFHFAAAQHEMNVPDSHFWEVNVKGTANLLEACLKANIKRYIHGSTIGVYGVLDGLIDENTPTNPDNIYGKTKLEGEKVVLSFKNKLPVTIIRIPETYGPGDRRLLKLFKTIKKGVFFMIGTGKNLHHSIYVDDLNDGFLQTAQNEAAIGQLILLSGKDVISTNEMVGTIAQVVNSKIPKIAAPLSLFWGIAILMEYSLRPLGIQPPLHRRRIDFFKKSYSFKQDKMKNLLHFEPQVSFKEGAQNTADWYKNMGLL